MRYISTNGRSPAGSLKEVVMRGLAPDGGLYMPERISPMPDAFFRQMYDMDLQETAFSVASHLLGEDIPTSDLKKMVYDTLDFPVPLVQIHHRLSTLELFHGPTMAFKDIGARFMARLLGYFNRHEQQEVNVLVATSGDTGSAVANGFYKVPGIRVVVLYPEGMVTPLQEKQFTTLGENITAVEVKGTFDDCQRMVKQAFSDEELNRLVKLTSANSINWARLMPQSFYYFWGVAQLGKKTDNITCAVPSGNFGNLCSGLIAKKMHLPIKRFIAATNINDIVPKYIENGHYQPKPSVATVANAMDVGNPSNFARILELYGHSREAICADIEGYVCTDEEIRTTIGEVYERQQYLLDPHGAVGYKALQDHLYKHPENTGFFIETAHPAKFRETVEPAIRQKIPLPANLSRFAGGIKQTEKLSTNFDIFKNFLIRSCV
ncbi:MAG: threonine synthase [Bacteroidales bacterium]|jgi:threonine synthase|nr:threonine synthase [Bacteroidales bacterium]